MVGPLQAPCLLSSALLTRSGRCSSLAPPVPKRLRISPNGKAKEAYEEAVALDPEDFWSWIELGRLRAKYDGLDRAEVAFKNGLQRAGDDRDRSVLHTEFGGLLSARGQLAKALEEFKQARTIHEALAKAEPGNAEWQRDLSVGYSRLAELAHPEYPWSRVVAKLEEMDAAGTLFPTDRQFLDAARRLAAAPNSGDADDKDS